MGVTHIPAPPPLPSPPAPSPPPAPILNISRIFRRHSSAIDCLSPALRRPPAPSPPAPLRVLFSPRLGLVKTATKKREIRSERETKAQAERLPSCPARRTLSESRRERPLPYVGVHRWQLCTSSQAMAPFPPWRWHWLRFPLLGRAVPHLRYISIAGTHARSHAQCTVGARWVQTRTRARTRNTGNTKKEEKKKHTLSHNTPTHPHPTHTHQGNARACAGRHPPTRARRPYLKPA